MVFKPQIKTILECVGAIVAVICFAIMQVVYWKNAAGLGVCLVFLLLLIPVTISSCRTLVMDREGCTVTLLWFKRTYHWEDLQVKRYVRYDDELSFWGCRTYFNSTGAEFSLKKAAIPFKGLFRVYSLLRYPFSFFYVHFQKPRSLFSEREDFENAFRKTMREWQVDMQEEA